jgi:hypothetical protein
VAFPITRMPAVGESSAKGHCIVSSLRRYTYRPLQHSDVTADVLCKVTHAHTLSDPGFNSPWVAGDIAQWGRGGVTVGQAVHAAIKSSGTFI